MYETKLQEIQDIRLQLIEKLDKELVIFRFWLNKNYLTGEWPKLDRPVWAGNGVQLWGYATDPQGFLRIKYQTAGLKGTDTYKEATPEAISLQQKIELLERTHKMLFS